ncbi:hypothetical protein ES703_48063 [subsurface metagenome]
MAEKLVTIAQFADYIEADLAKQLLDDFAIKSVVIGEKYGLPYPIPSQAELQVFEGQAQQALEILESHKKKEQ